MPDETPRLTATYRLQLHAGFPLDEARGLVSYLAELGVSHVYTSPVLAARPGSQHGYDVIDPARLNPELGTDAALRGLVEALRQADMGWILDIVPNHMAASTENPYWDDVLRLGTRSSFARWFDIEWDAPERWLRGRVMLPILGDELDAVVARDEVRVELAGERFRIRYFDHSLPVDPSTLWRLAEGLDAERDEAPAAQALREIADRSRSMGHGTGSTSRGANADDAATAHTVDAAVAGLSAAAGAEPNGGWLGKHLERFSAGEPGRVRLRALLDAQPYALTFWRRAARHINYRRFFEINDLVSVRQEDPEVFAATHAQILQWIAEGWLDGVRVDHVDGLFDPAEYLRRLRSAIDAASDGQGALPIYVEKILEHDESLRDEWPVAGTTGYETLNDIESVLLDADGGKAIEDAYRRVLALGDRGPTFADVARRAKQYVLRHSFDAEVRRVARLMAPVLRRRDRTARTSRRHLRDTIAQLAAALPVYRTYLTGAAPSPEDRALIERAESAARAGGASDPALLARIADVLLREDSTDAGDQTQLRRRAIGRFQQMTSPVMAKGIEDTALYMYVPLASLNEVGGTPDRDLTRALDRLHRGAAERRARWPLSLISTYTHDTKRSADVRSRLDVLSEIPELWEERVSAWLGALRGARTKVRGRYEPDANTEYLLFQALLGTWPAETSRDAGTIPDAGVREALRERLEQYVLKAAREAKMRTSWTEPNTAFENALRAYVAALLAEPGPFLASVAALAAGVVRPGFWNALARITMHMASPGVPDVYQGGELWSFSLVDPDNRRPVDYERRRAVLEELRRRFDAADPEARPSFVEELVAEPEDGRIKMHLTRQLLRTRRDHPDLFLDGSYEPLLAGGKGARHVIGFARPHAGRAALAVAPRLSRTLVGGVEPPIGDVWADTRVFVPDSLREVRRWTCVVSGHTVDVPRDAAATGLRVGELLRHCPVAFLVRADRARTESHSRA